MMRAALIDLTTSKVVNVIEYGENYTPPDGCIVVLSDSACIGDDYIDGAIAPAGA